MSPARHKFRRVKVKGSGKKADSKPKSVPGGVDDRGLPRNQSEREGESAAATAGTSSSVRMESAVTLRGSLVSGSGDASSCVISVARIKELLKALGSTAHSGGCEYQTFLEQIEKMKDQLLDQGITPELVEQAFDESLPGFKALWYKEVDQCESELSSLSLEDSEDDDDKADPNCPNVKSSLNSKPPSDLESSDSEPDVDLQNSKQANKSDTTNSAHQLPCRRCRIACCSNCLVPFKDGDKVIRTIASQELNTSCPGITRIPLEVAIFCIFEPNSAFPTFMRVAKKSSLLIWPPSGSASRNATTDGNKDNEKNKNGSYENLKAENNDVEGSKDKEDQSQESGTKEGERNKKTEQGQSSKTGEQEENASKNPKDQIQQDSGIKEGQHKKVVLDLQPDAIPVKKQACTELQTYMDIMFQEVESEMQTREDKTVDAYVELVSAKMDSVQFCPKDDGSNAGEDYPTSEQLKQFILEKIQEYKKLKTKEMKRHVLEKINAKKAATEALAKFKAGMVDFQMCVGCAELLTVLFGAWESVYVGKLPEEYYYHAVLIGLKNASKAREMIFNPPKDSKMYVLNKYSKECHPMGCHAKKVKRRSKPEAKMDYLKYSVGGLHAYMQESYRRVHTEWVKSFGSTASNFNDDSSQDDSSSSDVDVEGGVDNDNDVVVTTGKIEGIDQNGEKLEPKGEAVST